MMSSKHFRDIRREPRAESVQITDSKGRPGTIWVLAQSGFRPTERHWVGIVTFTAELADTGETFGFELMSDVYPDQTAAEAGAISFACDFLRDPAGFMSVLAHGAKEALKSMPSEGVHYA